jgi:hypothetical protein
MASFAMGFIVLAYENKRPIPQEKYRLKMSAQFVNVIVA